MKANSPILTTAVLFAIALLLTPDLDAVSDDLGSAQGATITGTVVDARTMQPLRGAIVSAARTPVDKPDAQPNVGFRTGEDGKFVLRGVAPGIVHFSVVKAGYASGPFASVRPAAHGERIDNVVLTVPPGASIGGRVLDESGQPVARMPVTVHVAGPIPAIDQLQPVRGVGATDDDGRYWVGGLAAGEYSIGVGSLTETPDIVSFGTDHLGLNTPDRAASSQPGRIAVTAGEDRVAPDLVIRFTDRFTGARPIDTNAATIAGQVVDSRGAPIPHAAVGLRHGDKAAVAATTRADAAGRFQFQNIAAGTFTLGTAQPVAIGAMTPIRPTTVEVAADSRIENVVVTGSRGGTISGTVTDEFGDPAHGVVIAMSSTLIESPGEYVSLISRPEGGRMLGRPVIVDARGRYRITGLPPGEYLVSIVTGDFVAPRTEIHVEDQGPQDRLYKPGSLFYPGVPTVSQAAKVAVVDAGESAGIDVVVRPALAASINVTVTANRPVTEVQLHQILLDERLPILEKTAKLAGTSVTLDATVGRYRLLASAEVASDADNVVRLWSSADVDTDPLIPAAVNLVLEPGANVAGRVFFEGKEPNRQGAGARLVPMAALPGINIAIIDGSSTFTVSTGEFAIEGVMPGRYVIQAGGTDRPGELWMLKAATIRGRDVLDKPIELAAGEEIDNVLLTVTDRVTELSGRVADATDKPSRDDWVAIFSVDNKYWFPGSRHVRVVRPGANGRYVVRALPPGTYVVSLSASPISQDELAAKLPPLVSTSIRVTLAEGDRKGQDLRSIRR